jgi:thymidylate kinase
MLLDIAPETAVQRKAADRDRYERDLALLSRVRESYLRQAAAGGWVVLDGERPKDAIAADVFSAAGPRLARP